MLHDPTIGIMCSIITIFIAALQGKIYSHKEIVLPFLIGKYCVFSIKEISNGNHYCNRNRSWARPNTMEQ